MDLDPKFRPTVRGDVMQLDERSLGSFDMVWPGAHGTRDWLVLRTLEIIGNLRPRFWAMKNPQTGLLKTRAFMQELPYSDVCYCKYGFRYKKATRIWHNLPWEPSQTMCCKGDRCEAFVDGIHPETAQRGTTNGRRNQQSQRQLYSMPPQLCDEIAAAASG